MLTEDIVSQLRAFSGNEDQALWGQGDVLHENQITKDEMRRLAVILGQSPAALFNRQFVAAENPIEKRSLKYSWKLYATFTKIADPELRYQTLFSRDEWRLEDAKEFVKALNPPVLAEDPKLTHVERAELRVGKVVVKAKLNPNGELTLLVNVGGGGTRDCNVTYQSVNTKIVFPA